MTPGRSECRRVVVTSVPRVLMLSSLVALIAATTAHAATVDGELRQWHRVEIVFDGPSHAESDDSPNPFLDYRLQCLLTGPSGQSYDVPGFFDAGGTGSGSSGSKWKCRFAPDEPGTWQYEASFRQGNEVAVSLAANPGSTTSFDGDSGSFLVAISDKAEPDFRAGDRGLLRNAGAHYLQFAGSGEPWMKGGPNIPENLLGYSGFDDTPNAHHDFAPHVGDWNSGDPDWNGGDGKAIVGLLNYVSETGGNSLYFLPMNIGGDGQDAFPTIDEQDKTHYDTSKLAQWETVFEHADRLGIFLHFQLSETEPDNANYHDDGELGPERKLYYRELIARFGHHLGIEWDLGEENEYGTARREAFAAYLRDLDPYDHSITSHLKGFPIEDYYGPLLGNPDFEMTAFQVSWAGVDGVVSDWRAMSAAAGEPWVVCVDEPQPIENDPNDDDVGYPHGRRRFLWPVYMSGGGGFEWYVQEDGGGHGLDNSIEDLRQLEPALVWTRHARAFMERLPLLSMDPDQDLSTADYTMADLGDVYAMYDEQGDSVDVDLSASTDTFAVTWFDPENGTWHPGGTVAGGGWRSLGVAPFAGDAAVVVESGTPSGGPCTLDSECDDLDPCTVDTCDGMLGCSHDAEPATGCMIAGKARLVVKNRVPDKRNRINWRWQGGPAVGQGDLGNPSVTTTYALCIFDTSGGRPSLATSLSVGPDPVAWKSRDPRGWKYKDRDAARDGVDQIKLKTGGDGKATLDVKANGAAIPMPAPVSVDRLFEEEPSVIVQLLAGNGACWTSDLEEGKNRADFYKAKTR